MNTDKHTFEPSGTHNPVVCQRLPLVIRAGARVRLQFWIALGVLATRVAAWGQSTSDSEWNHFGLDFRVGLNIKTKFNNIGASTAVVPSALGGTDHNYADGFVRVDSSGDRGALTWNWGYQNASQISGQDTLLLHAASTQGASVVGKDDPRLGFEANYARDLAYFGSGRWGLKLALGYTDVQVRDSQALSGNVNLVTDAYALGGITPPVAPYAGSFSGPGPVIGDTPTRTISTVPGSALITGSRQLDVWLYDLRFGPYLELPLVERLTFQVGAGVAAGLVDSTFSFSDTTAMTSAGSVRSTGSGQKTGSLLGFYGEAGMAYQLLPRASIFAGGQFQYLGEFNQSVGGRAAQLDLRRSIYLVVGVQWHF
jgi:hypothetical protein